MLDFTRYLKDFLKITKPLCMLLEKDVPFVFDEKYMLAFQTLNLALIFTLIIITPNWSAPFELICDVSDYTIGAILRHRKHQVFHSIYYNNKTLLDAQLNYVTT